MSEFLSENFVFFFVVKFSVYLKRLVFVMMSPIEMERDKMFLVQIHSAARRRDSLFFFFVSDIS